MTRPCRTFLAGEGPSDIGDLSRPAPYRDDREGFLQPVLRKLAPPRVRLEFEGVKLSTIGRGTVKTSGRLFARKAAQAYVLAEEGGFDVVVFACDVDRMSGVARSMGEARGRIAELASSIERGFSDARARGRDRARAQVKTIVATPCRMIEAWALGDAAALARLAVRHGSTPHGERPEELWGDERDPCSRHPKRVLERILAGRPDFAAIGGEADLAELERTCPLSFEPFARSARAKLG